MNQARTVNFVRIPIIKVENLCWLMFTNCVVSRVNQNVFRLFPFRSRRGTPNARDWDLIYAPFIASRAPFTRRSIPSTSFPTLVRGNINSRDNHRQCAINWEARKRKWRQTVNWEEEKPKLDCWISDLDDEEHLAWLRHVVVVCNK